MTLTYKSRLLLDVRWSKYWSLRLDLLDDGFYMELGPLNVIFGWGLMLD